MEHFDYDDAISVFSYEDGGEYGSGDVSQRVDALKQEAENAQRLGLLRNQAAFVTGSMQSCTGQERGVTNEKRFHMPKLYTWNAGEPEDLLADLATRRVRARLQAAMGLGKSTRLASTIAEKLDMRVLVVAPDAHGLRQNSDYIRAAGIGRYRRMWGNTRAARVCCMTYADYCGHHMQERPGEVYKAFEVIIFDEGFEDRAVVEAAKAAFAVYASQTVSLLVCSATISADVGAQSGSAAMGNFRVVEGNLSLTEMMRSEKLVTDYLVDRSYVVVPTDAQVAELEEYYELYGVDAVALDSASTYADFLGALEALRGDAVTPRVVVMHPKWALGFNLEVEYGVIRPFRSAWMEEDGVWRETEYAMSPEYVAQAKARTGRGIAGTSGGVIVGSAREKSVQLHRSEVDKAFFLLLAMRIRPLQVGKYASCYERYPAGFSPAVAYTVLTINLPPAIAVRYLASDGRVAKKFATAVTMFTHIDRYHHPSEEEEPVNYSSWVDDTYINTTIDTGEVVTESHRRVPVKAEGELAVVLHAISAMADGELELERWRPPSVLPIGDVESDPAAAVASKALRMRRAELREVEAEPEIVSQAQVMQLQLGDPIGPDGLPVKRYLSKQRLYEAFMKMDGFLRTSMMPVEEVDAVESERGTVVEVPVESGNVDDADGKFVCALPVKICEKLNQGLVLETREFLELMRIISGIEPQFVQSRVFDAFAHPWTSVLHTILAPGNLQAIIKCGEWTKVYNVVATMRKRFEYELVTILKRSNVTRSLFARLFKRKCTADELLARVFRGDFHGIGQSDGFFFRVQELKRLLDGTLVMADKHGVYLANDVSHAQVAPGLGAPQLVGAGRGRWERPSGGSSNSVVHWHAAHRHLKERFDR